MSRYTLSIRKIFGLEPRNPPTPGASRELAREFVDRGIAAEESGAIEEAQRCYRDAISADSQFAQAHLCLGIVLQASGQTAAAIDAHRRAIALDPACAAAHYNLGLASLQAGAVTQAEVGFRRKSLALRAEFPEAWVGLAEALEDARTRGGSPCGPEYRNRPAPALRGRTHQRQYSVAQDGPARGG